MRIVRHRLAERHATLMHLGAHLRQQTPALRVAAAKTQLQAARNAMFTALDRQLAHYRHRLAVASGALDVVSPLATLQRGYAIVTDGAGAVITDAAQLRPGDALNARLARGKLYARVERTEPRSESRDNDQRP
jgi:exodeoxyribonuclease VII large subunit